MGKFSLAEHIQKAQPPQARDIETITAEILDAKRVGGEAILTIGKGLIEAKAMLPHGDWLPWLEDRVEISTRMAQNYMRLAQHYSNTNALSYLGATKALQLLALPESERDEFLNEPHDVGGGRKNVIDMTSRELAIAIKERDDALRTAAQAQADQSAAEQAREKLSADMALANERIAGLNAEVEAQSGRAREAQATAARLEKELEELRSRPVEVAVETDPAAIEAARREAETAMQDKLDEAEAASEQSHAAAEQARRELKQAQIELDALRAKAAQAEKKASLAANEDFVLFKTILERLQEDGNRLCGLILKERNKDQKMAEGFSNAFFACLDKMRKEAQG